MTINAWMMFALWNFVHWKVNANLPLLEVTHVIVALLKLLNLSTVLQRRKRFAPHIGMENPYVDLAIVMFLKDSMNLVQ